MAMNSSSMLKISNSGIIEIMKTIQHMLTKIGLYRTYNFIIPKHVIFTTITRKGTYPDPLPATTPEVSTNQHPLILIVIFLVLFQLHSVSKHLSSIIINFCIVLLQDIYPTASIPTSLATLHCVTGFSPLTDALRKYVSCPRCHSLFLLADLNCPKMCINDDIGYPNSC